MLNLKNLLIQVGFLDLEIWFLDLIFACAESILLHVFKILLLSSSVVPCLNSYAVLSNLTHLILFSKSYDKNAKTD